MSLASSRLRIKDSKTYVQSSNACLTATPSKRFLNPLEPSSLPSDEVIQNPQTQHHHWRKKTKPLPLVVYLEDIHNSQYSVTSHHSCCCCSGYCSTHLRFFSTTGAGLALYIVLIITHFIVLCPLYYYYQRHPLNYFLLGVFTLALSFAVGLTCAYTSGKVILESAILTAVVVVSLTLYTFWAAKRGQDFNFLGPFLFGAVVVLMLFSLVQIFFPLGRVSLMIYGCLASIIFCGYIIYDTDNLIKRYTYDEYIWAAVALY